MESAELIALLHEVRDRVRARNPQTAAGGVPRSPLPDLMPLVHARDAALGKVAAIGTVNPRAGGVVNSLVQAWKRLVARVLDWHVREQVEFNRKSMACIDAALEALNEYNRALVALGSRIGGAGAGRRGAEGHSQSLGRLALRVGAQAAAERNSVPAQRGRSAGRLPASRHPDGRQLSRRHARRSTRSSRRAWSASRSTSRSACGPTWRRIRLEYERLIYSELQTIRQRAAVSALRRRRREPAAPPGRRYPPNWASTTAASRSASAAPRSTSRPASSSTCPTSRDCRNVLDIGCGRGEFLEMMRDAGVPAQGIDLSEESVATVPPQGTGGRGRRPVRVPGEPAGSVARRHLLFAGGGASAAGAAAGDDPAVRQPALSATA